MEVVPWDVKNDAGRCLKRGETPFITFFRTINLVVTKVCVCLPTSDVCYKLNSISAHCGDFEMVLYFVCNGR